MWDILPEDLYTELAHFLSEADIDRARKTCASIRAALGDDIEDITTTSSPSDQQAWCQELQHISKLAPRLCKLTAPHKLNHIATQRLSTLSTLANLKSLHIPNGQFLRDASIAHITALNQLHHLQINRAAQLTHHTLHHLRNLPSLSSLDLKECHNISWSPFLMAQQQNIVCTADAQPQLPSLLPGLTKLAATCSAAFATQPALEGKAIASLKGLNNLELQRCNLLTDSALEQLCTLSQLTHLKLVGLWSTSDKGLASLASLRNLSSLSLTDPARATSAGLAAGLSSLTGLSSLQLCLPGSQVAAAELQSLLAQLQVLVSLELSYPGCDDELFEALAALPLLQELTVSGACQLSSAAMASLRQATALCALHLRDCYGVCGAAVLAAAAGLTSLQSLILDNLVFPISEGEPQEAVPELAASEQQSQQPAQQQVLSIGSLEVASCAFFADAHLAQIARLCPQLRCLTLSSCSDVTDAGVAEAGRLPLLRQLRLAGCQVDGSFAHKLAGLPLLAEVTVKGSELLDDCGCQLISELSALRKAGVSGCLEVGLDGLAALLALPHLRRVDASGCRAAVVAEALELAPEHIRLVHDL